jgi:FAD/FMN-containing dehydrogenase
MSRRKVLSGLVTGAGLAVLGWSPGAKTWVTDPAAAGDLRQVPPLDGSLVLPPNVAGFTEDFGHLVHRQPQAVLIPGSVADIGRMVDYAKQHRIKIAVNGQGGSDGARESHSQYGQALVDGGIAIDPKPLSTIHHIGPGIADIGAGATWAVLATKAAESGQKPPVTNDFMHLSIGGTLSVGGLGGAVQRYGLQVDNVKELEVVTGCGDVVTCSRNRHRELFDAVLAGGGQFGIIVRAVIALVPAEPMVRSVDVLYDDLETFLRDSISVMRSGLVHDQNGYLVPREGGGWQFRMELAVGFSPPNEPDESPLEHLAGQVGATVDMSHLDWLFRFEPGWAQLKEAGFWAARKPWVSLMVAATETPAFMATVLAELTPDQLGVGGARLSPMNADAIKRPMFMLPRRQGPQLFEMTLVRFLPPDHPDIEGLLAQNRRFYDRAVALGGKRYLIGAIPDMSQQDWRTHYGDRWAKVQKLKRKYDPSNVLTPGQRMFP